MAMESLDQKTVRRPGDVKADCGHGLEADCVGRENHCGKGISRSQSLATLQGISGVILPSSGKTTGSNYPPSKRRMSLEQGRYDKSAGKVIFHSNYRF